MSIRGIDIEQRVIERLPDGLRARLERADDALITGLRAYGPHVLRVALGAVFVWFGALKVAGRSPVEDLVTETVYWLPSGFVVSALGVWEVIVGLGLIFPVALRLTLALFWAQMAGTFLVLVVDPGLSFQEGNPLLLTTEGEFVIKNLVLIAAGLVVGATLRRPRSDPGGRPGLRA